MFSPGTIDEEVSTWSDWALIFKNYIAFMDPRYLEDFVWSEQRDGPIREGEYEVGSDKGRRAVKLRSILSSYFKNRPLKILRSVVNNDGFEVWRRLVSELQPTSRSRSLAMAPRYIEVIRDIYILTHIPHGGRTGRYLLGYSSHWNPAGLCPGPMYSCHGPISHSGRRRFSFNDTWYSF